MKIEKVKYDIKLDNSQQVKGTIDFDRIAFLAEKISKIAKGALQIRIGGISHKKGKSNKQLDKSLQIRLTGIKEGSTILNCETQTFANTIPGFQIDAFRPEVATELPKLTPMSLFMMTFTEAFDTSNDDKPFIDKLLIKDLVELKAFFRDENEELIISNNNVTPTIKLKREDFSKIKELEESYPEPQNIVVSGKIDVLQHSKSKVTISTVEGSIYGTLKHPGLAIEIKQYWGTEATVHGIGHFKPNGRLNFIEIERIYQSNPDDKYFSKLPLAETAEQQVLKQVIGKPNRNWAAQILGQWPGNESDEEFDKLLKDI